jgi:DNA-binding CsgD family transcriptional regulator
MTDDKKDDENKVTEDSVPTADTYVGKFLATLEANEDAVVGLTDRQKQVFKLKLRGFTQRAIGEVMNISQPAVSKHWKAIRERFAEIGATIDQNQVVGESVSLYKEIEERAWDLFYTAKSAGKLGDSNKALSTIMVARNKSLSLLMDLGLLRRAAVEHEHNVSVSPLIDEWRAGDAQKKIKVTTQVISTQLDELEDPLPPLDITDAEIIELDDLDDPTPPDED